jgi:hypothetical protein
VGPVSRTFEVTTSAAPVAPAQFSIPPVTGAAFGTPVNSMLVVPTGLDKSTTISVSGQGNPKISVNGGPWTTSATFAPGQGFYVTLTSAATGGVQNAAVVAIGNTTREFDVTTAIPDRTPAAFSLPVLIAQAPSTVVNSATVTPTGYNTPTGITVTGDGNVADSA